MAATDRAAPAAGPWRDLIRKDYATYSAIVLLGTLLHALQILVISIVMPTIVADLGGAVYYAWTAIVYTVGSIVGAATVEPITRAVGRRVGYVAVAVVFMLSTAGCALAPDIFTLIAARGIQGFAGGLIIGASMALIGVLFPPHLRARILAAYQGVWMFAQLLGPVFGGAFAEFGWWRGSFWSLIPFIACYAALIWWKVPDTQPRQGEHGGGFPFFRLTVLTAGVIAVAAAGPIDDTALRAILIVAAIALVWTTFRLDRTARTPLFPTRTLSLSAVVGLGLLIHFLVGSVQTSITLFVPLLLQVFHGVPPIYVSFVSIVLSLGWTVGTFMVNGWTGSRERLALWWGPVIVVLGLALMTATTTAPGLVLLTVAAFLVGFGVGIHNVHLITRTIARADPGEEGLTAASLPSVRSLGTAFGAALAGMLTAIAGFDDTMTRDSVGDAVTFVFGVNLVPAVLMVLLMFRLLAVDTGSSRQGEAA
ncbi:MAG: MFS transporter [Defluviicoccus sp.]|nr:MFS transporter [Defluviicoccus sp.]